MPKRLFVTGFDFDLISSTGRNSLLPRRKLTLETVRHLDLFRRALQALPPRELGILYQLHVLNQQQKDIGPLYEVLQGNVSYHQLRAQYRIKLHHEIWSLISETQFRQTLIDAGVAHDEIALVLGVVKTSSQTASAQANHVSVAKVRSVWERAQRSLRKQQHQQNPHHRNALALITLINANLNQLRALAVQPRFRHKVQSRRRSPGPSRNAPTPRTNDPATTNPKPTARQRKLDKVRAIVARNPGLGKNALMQAVMEQMNVAKPTAYQYLQDIRQFPPDDAPSPETS